MFLQPPNIPSDTVVKGDRKSVDRQYNFLKLFTEDDFKEMDALVTKYEDAFDTDAGPKDSNGNEFSIGYWVTERCKMRLNELPYEERNKHFNDKACDHAFFIGAKGEFDDDDSM